MRTDNDLIRDDIGDALARSAEQLDDHARATIRHRVMGSIRHAERTRFFASVAHRVAAAAAAISVLGGGVAYATNAAMPGDPLYPLKRGAEDALIAVLPSGALEHALLVELAERRAHEAAHLATEGAAARIIADTIGALRKAVAEAASRDGTLAGEDAVRIQEQGQDAPTQTRDAIFDAVSSSGSTSSDTDGQASPSPETPAESGSSPGGGSPTGPDGSGNSNETTGGAGPR